MFDCDHQIRLTSQTCDYQYAYLLSNKTQIRQDMTLITMKKRTRDSPAVEEDEESPCERSEASGAQSPEEAGTAAGRMTELLLNAVASHTSPRALTQEDTYMHSDLELRTAIQKYC